MIAWIRTTSLALIGGWLAQCLAATDGDVDNSVAAYDAKRYDDALAALDEAQARLGERPELSLNRGLILLAKGDREGAARAFEHASEATVADIAASGHYQLGNLAMDDEAWDRAVEKYSAALKLQPEHSNAKWNLELALHKQNEPDSSSSDSSSDSSSSDASNSTDSNSDTSSSGDPSASDPSATDPSASDSSATDSPTDSGSSDSSGSPSSQGEDSPDTGGSSTGESGESGSRDSQGEKSTGSQQPSDTGSGATPTNAGSSAAPSPIDRADLDKALEQLDREDSFNFGAPRQDAAPVEKDW